MKKLLLTLFSIGMIGVAQAQKKYCTYDNSVLQKTYDIQVSSKPNGSYTVWIDAASLEGLSKTAGIMVEDNQLLSFTTSLNEAKLKYAEWTKVAKENNVQELSSKRMSIKTKVGGYFLYGGEWEFQWTAYLNFDFRVVQTDGVTKYLLVVSTGELQSSSNQFIKIKGTALAFQDTKEVDAFIAAISPQKISEFLAKPKPEDLFKE